MLSVTPTANMEEKTERMPCMIMPGIICLEAYMCQGCRICATDTVWEL